MTSDDILPTKFIKVLIPESCASDMMSLPTVFCDKYGPAIPKIVTLVIRTGEEISVKFKRSRGILVGMKQLFERFDCTLGAYIVFQYNGCDNFWVHVLGGGSGTELGAELVEHVGVKFIKIMLCSSRHWKKMTIPCEFLRNFGHLLPEKIIFRLSDGQTIEGSYDKSDQTFVGLQQVYKLAALTLFEILVFTYCGGPLFDVSPFNVKCMEKCILDYNPRLYDLDYFEIEIKPSHLLQYCFGVNISVKFKSLTNKWGHLDNIHVTHGDKSWLLTLKKRSTKTTFHAGWTNFCVAMELSCGDICLFKKAASYKHFNVEVYKYV